MTAFEFLTVAVSIILALGVTQLLTAVVRLIERREEVVWDWITVTWAIVILVSHLQFWWAVFGLRALPQWSFIAFTMLMGEAFFLFLAASLVLPRAGSGADADLAAHFLQNGRWAVLAIIFYGAFGWISDFILFELPLLSGWNALRLITVGVLLWVFRSESRRVHAIGTIFFVVAVVYWMVPTLSVAL